MNAIAPVPPRGLPALSPAGPSLSPDLRAAVRRAIEAPDAPTVPLTAMVKGEAAQALARFDRVLAPLTPVTLRAWLTPVAMAVRNPPTRSDFEARFAAILVACADLPDCACTGTSQRAALASFAFWPSAADVRSLLAGAVADLFRTRAGLRRVAEGRADSAVVRATLGEAREGFDRVCAALSAGPAPKPRQAVSPRGTAPALSRPLLCEMYRAAGLSVPGEAAPPAPEAPFTGEAA